MADIWYLNTDTETLDGMEPRYIIPFKDCIDLFELSDDCWKCKSKQIPDLKTGNQLIDESGYIYVLVKVMSKELKAIGKRGWKAGWYLSPLTVINAEKKLYKSQAKPLESE
ncbi:MAG: hypothetical protein ACE5H1_09785 [Thermodesulfobacteriota bacterium]